MMHTKIPVRAKEVQKFFSLIRGSSDILGRELRIEVEGLEQVIGRLKGTCYEACALHEHEQKSVSMVSVEKYPCDLGGASGSGNYQGQGS
jgi:hypothetical protein